MATKTDYTRKCQQLDVLMYGHEHKDHYNGLERLLSEPMTEAEAKAILNSYGAPVNIAKHIEAINTAIRAVGGKATMAEIWRWAKNDKDSDNDTP